MRNSWYSQLEIWKSVNAWQGEKYDQGCSYQCVLQLPATALEEKYQGCNTEQGKY